MKVSETYEIIPDAIDDKWFRHIWYKLYVLEPANGTGGHRSAGSKGVSMTTHGGDYISYFRDIWRTKKLIFIWHTGTVYCP